jgi:hypothetical protein
MQGDRTCTVPTGRADAGGDLARATPAVYALNLKLLGSVIYQIS